MAFRPAIPHKKVDSCLSSPVCHCSTQGLAAKSFTVRLACLRYTASVRPEPGSNSQKKLNRFRHSHHSSNDKNLEKYYPADNYFSAVASLVNELGYFNSRSQPPQGHLFRSPFAVKTHSENPNRYPHFTTNIPISQNIKFTMQNMQYYVP